MNILVPPDIVPVKRVSPIKVKKRTVWRERPEGEPIERGREWMADNLFVADSFGSQLERLVPASFTIHVIAAIVVVAVILLTQAPRVTPFAKVHAPLMMPAMLSFLPVAEASVAQPDSKPSARPAPPKPVPLAPAAAPPAAASSEDAPPPLEAPPTTAPDTASSDGPHDIDGGVDGGVPGGTVGGVVGGSGPADGGGTSAFAIPAGPIRVRSGIDPPRKIKDVKPAYPAFALAGQRRGTVIIEATVDANGKVQEATIVRSVRALDDAALEAVRQWEYLPARMNGVPIAVIITVLVQFAIH